MNEWEEFELDECCEILSSKRIFASDYVTNGIPFYRSKEIIEKAHGQFGGDELYITHDRFNEIKEKFGAPIKGDLLISAVGNRSGIPYCVREDYDFYFKDGNLIWFRNFSEELDSKFLEYILSSNLGQKKIEAIMIGSAQKALTIAGIKKIKFNLPPLTEQKAIAQILGKLDDKIELNRKTNETLKAMAQALFKSWFVDFDLVLDKVLAAGNDIPEALQAKAKKRQLVPDDKKLIHNNPELASLFPSTFVFNETLDKWIPEGWEVKSFEELIETTIGGDWGKEFPDEKHTEEVRIIRGTDIPSILNCDVDSAPMRYVEAKKLKTRKLEVGDIVIEVSGGSPTQPTGRSIYITQNIIDRLGGVVEPASFCRRFKPISKEYGVLCAEQLKYIYEIGKMWEYQNQSTGIANFQTKYFLEAEKVLVPSKANITKEFFKQVSVVNVRKTSNEIIVLTQLRDTLLPQLISGKLRVPEGMLKRFQEQTKVAT